MQESVGSCEQIEFGEFGSGESPGVGSIDCYFAAAVTACQLVPDVSMLQFHRASADGAVDDMP